MPNKTMYIIITAVVIMITLSLLHVAYSDDLWREFVVSEFVVLVTAGTLSFMLRKPEEKAPEEK